MLDEAIKSLQKIWEQQAKKAREWEKLQIVKQYEEGEECMRRF